MTPGRLHNCFLDSGRTFRVRILGEIPVFESVLVVRIVAIIMEIRLVQLKIQCMRFVSVIGELSFLLHFNRKRVSSHLAWLVRAWCK